MGKYRTDLGPVYDKSMKSLGPVLRQMCDRFGTSM